MIHLALSIQSFQIHRETVIVSTSLAEYGGPRRFDKTGMVHAYRPDSYPYVSANRSWVIVKQIPGL